MDRVLRSAALSIAAKLLALAGAASEFADAQERRRYATLVSPNVACRAGPSSSAEVVEFLRLVGDHGLDVIEGVDRTETDAAGETWAYVGPANTRWARLSQGCWVHESALAPTDGYGRLSENHLLRIADGVLAAPEGRPLADVVAAYNVFTDPRHMELVAGSPVLAARQRDLLTRVLVVVKAERLAERDPLVTVWLQSLGEQAGDAIPPREPPEPAPPGSRELAIIAPDVACRRTPAAAALGGATLSLDHHFLAQSPDTSVAGDAWTLVFDDCWVPASLTAPTADHEHVLAIADRFIAASEGRSAENLLWVYSVLARRAGGHRDAVEASALLGMRRLELLEAWLTTFDSFGVDPLTLALVRSLDAEVWYFEPGGHWTLSDDAWLALHERHRGSPDAHEIIWKLANSQAHEDCEGSMACYAHVWVVNRVARYWVAYPDGPRVAEAVASARDRLRGAVQACEAAEDAPPGSPEAGLWDSADWTRAGAAVARELRESLRDVSPEDRAPMIELLDALQKCAGRNPQHG